MRSRRPIVYAREHASRRYNAVVDADAAAAASQVICFVYVPPNSRHVVKDG